MAKKKSTYTTRLLADIRQLEAQRDAAIAGQHALQRKLDEANAQNTAHESYAARLRAEHDRATARLRTENEAIVMRYATRENELRNDLAECVKTLRANGWEHSVARGWQRESVMVVAPPMMSGPASDAVRHQAAMHQLRSTPFGHVACDGIVRAIAAYLNPRCGNDRSAEAPAGSAWAPPAEQPRDR